MKLYDRTDNNGNGFFQTSNNNLPTTTQDEFNENEINDILMKIWKVETLTTTEIFLRTQ